MNKGPEAPPPPPIPGMPTYNERPPTNGMAVASLACGVFGWVLFVGGILAVVLGVVARRQIRESPDPQGGAWLALGGIVTGVVGAVISVLTLYAFWLA